MYTEALAERNIFCSEKMVLKLGFVLMALAVFSGQGLNISANENVIHYYVQENIMKEEQNNALFLLKENWNLELKKKYANNKIREIDDGIVYIKLVKNIKGRRIKVNVAEINRNINSDIEVIPQMSSGKIHSRSKINNIAKGAKIAVNGTYFKQDTGTPLGLLVINNEIISGPIYDRVAIGIKEEGFISSRVSFEGYIKNGENKVKVNNINQPRMLFADILMYTKIWGEKSPITKAGSRHITIDDNIITAISDKSSTIPEKGCVITGSYAKLKAFKVGDKVEINYNMTPNMLGAKHIISGGPYLLKTGNIFVDAADQKLNAITGRNPRTAVGYTRDNVLIMVTVEGRKEGSTGVTLFELAKIMKDLGCYEAINLDGGSSTVMYVDGTILSGSDLKNSVSINNALVVRNKKII